MTRNVRRPGGHDRHWLKRQYTLSITGINNWWSGKNYTPRQEQNLKAAQTNEKTRDRPNYILTSVVRPRSPNFDSIAKKPILTTAAAMTSAIIIAIIRAVCPPAMNSTSV